MSSKAAEVVKTIGGIDYHFLSPTNWYGWEIVDREFKARGLDPLPRNSKVAMASDDDSNTSFYCLQAMLHAEPMVLCPAHKKMGGKVLLNLVAMVQAQIGLMTVRGRDAYVIAEEPGVADLCESFGMELVQVPVYRKRISKE